MIVEKQNPGRFFNLSGFCCGWQAGLCPFLAAQQQTSGFTQRRRCLFTGGFAANPIGVGCVVFSTKSKTPHTPSGEALRDCSRSSSPCALRRFFAYRWIHATMQKIHVGIVLPNTSFRPFAQMDKVQARRCGILLPVGKRKHEEIRVYDWSFWLLWGHLCT